MTVNGNNIINNENIAKSIITVDLEKSSDTDTKGLKLSYYKDDDGDGKLNTKATTVKVDTIAKYTTHAEIKDNNGTVEFNFEQLPEGKNVIQLLDSTGKVLTETIVTKDTLTIPVAVEVTTKRIDTSKASMSFKAKEGSDIVKMYYAVLPVSNDNSTIRYVDITNAIKKISNGDSADNSIVAAAEVEVKDNKFEGTIATNLVNNTAYRVIYVVENSLGNRFYGKDSTKGTNVVASKPVTTKATIAKDVYGTNAEKEVKSITLPDLENNGPADANFEWTLSKTETEDVSAKTFKVEVLDEKGKVLNEVEITGTNTASLNELGITTPGTYKIKVTVKGKDNGNTSASESVESKTITIDSYEAVKNIEFVNEDNEKTLTWESNYTIINEEGEGNIAGYIVDLYEYDTKTDEYKKLVSASNLSSKEKKLDISAYITANKLYKAEVRVEANPNQSAKLTAEVGESKEFFVLAGTSISVSKDENKKDKITTDSVTLKATKAVVGNKEVSYDLRVWKKNTNTGDFDGARYAEVTNKYMSNVQLSETSEVEVTGLEEGATYRFELIVKVDSAEASRTTGDITLLKLPIEIKGLVVSETPGEGKIAKTTDGISIDDVEVKSTDFVKYANSAELTVVSSLLQNTPSLVYGDKITLDEDKLTVELQAQASTSSVAARDFGNKLEGMTVELKGNTSDKIIKTTANTKGPKEIILSEGSNFDISGVTAEKITLKNNVSVKTGINKVTVADGATVTINGVIVTAKNTELTLKSDAQGTKNFTVDPTGSGVNADITFENTTTDAVTINFVGENDLSGRQQGSITIRSASGKVTLSSQNFNIESKIDVVVEKGEVDISSKFLTGDKTVSVKSADSKNTAKVTIEGPEVPTEIANVKIDKYTLIDRSESSLKSFFNSSSNQSKNIIDKTVSLSNTKAVKEYFDSFKEFFDKGATLSKAANSTTVTITFTKAVDGAIDMSNLTK